MLSHTSHSPTIVIVIVIVVGRPYYFLVEPLELTFDLGNYEPFWGYLTLYEITETRKQKLSETFCFDLNSDSIEMMTGFLVRASIAIWLVCCC